jgi:hypothetical protein
MGLYQNKENTLKKTIYKKLKSEPEKKTQPIKWKKIFAG